MPAKFLMIQGTASHVGKSVIVAALCRIFANRGIRVAPFKAQNMALNSAVTADGLEVGRSTAVQAKAARTELRVEMNPVLLKPKAETIAQLILHGKPYGDVSASDQFQGNRAIKDLKLGAIRQSLETLSREYELIIIEGAGSPAEVNLRQFDVVNMAVAELVKAPVLLVADIDRGGAIAALVGTYALLSKKERGYLCGLIINKFRGDKSLLDPALKFLKQQTGCLTLGVIPYDSQLHLMEEDTLPGHVMGTGDPQIEIVVVEHRHFSNFTDVDPLAIERGVLIRYVRVPERLGRPDAIIVPGTKNTVGDLRIHFESGLAARILKLAEGGTPVLGICGGYQMMGKVLLDPHHLESDYGDLEGLGLLEVETRFRSGKITQQVSIKPAGLAPFLSEKQQVMTGYEIHSGDTRPLHPRVHPAFFRITPSDNPLQGEGAVNRNGLVFGTSVHGLFENDRFRRQFVDVVRERRGFSPLPDPILIYRSISDQNLEQWAQWVERHLDFQSLQRIVYS